MTSRKNATTSKSGASDRLSRQVGFILEMDKAKGVLRSTFLTDGSRLENDAEHSWHVALMALVLAEHAGSHLDVARAVKMLLIHDLVEIDVGDTIVYDEAARAQKRPREVAAAERIFNLLPPDQASEFRALWDEYEERLTPEARFAGALDRLQPLLHNYATKGAAWRSNGINSTQVMRVNRVIAEGSPALWELARSLIEDAVERGYLDR